MKLYRALLHVTTKTGGKFEVYATSPGVEDTSVTKEMFEKDTLVLQELASSIKLPSGNIVFQKADRKMVMIDINSIESIEVP